MANNLPTRLVVSVYGPHAGEDEMEILNRKMEDIRKIGFTMWFYGKSNRFARPNDVQTMSRRAIAEGVPPQMWLIHPSTIGGAQQTSKPPVTMREMSADGSSFTTIDRRLTPVTGGNDGFAFVISKIEVVRSRVIDLSKYADPTEEHVGFKIGNSTQVLHLPNKPQAGTPMRKPIRSLWALCELKEPYCVFVR